MFVCRAGTFSEPTTLLNCDYGSSSITGDTIQFRKSEPLFQYIYIFVLFYGCGAFRVPVRGSLCLPSIPAGLFCHRLCAPRHGRRRRQRVGQPSPTAVLLHPGTRRKPSQYENKFSPLFAINFPLVQRRGGKKSVLTTYSRLCTESLAVQSFLSLLGALV